MLGCHDVHPDAPTDSDGALDSCKHSANVTNLDERSQPGTRLRRTPIWDLRYRGPCPPVGAEPHRYVVTVYALDVSTLPLAVTSSGAMASFMINSHLLAKTSITGYFGR